MIWLSRPWGRPARLADGMARFEAADSLMAEGDEALGARGVPVLRWQADDRRRLGRYILPYPADGLGLHGARLLGFPPRWPPSRQPETEADHAAVAALGRMKSLMSRLHEVEEALDQPADLWVRLGRAWDAAADDEVDRLSEIVRHSRPGAMPKVLALLEPRIRRVLRRVTELTPLGRVEEIDRKAMIWLSRQPGTTLAQRAGSRQRIMAVARHPDFDTVENRVLHAYARAAILAGRVWLRDNRRASGSPRFVQVAAFERRCARLAQSLADLGVGVAPPGVTPNYVLTEDPAYREVRASWERLLREERSVDDYWGWQAQSWIDFVALALVRCLLDRPSATLVSQSPIRWLGEPERGRWFEQDNPLAVIWLRPLNAVVDIQSRPERVSSAMALCGAPLWLRLTRLDGGPATRLPVWPRHVLGPFEPIADLNEAAQVLVAARTRMTTERLGKGLIVGTGIAGTEIEGGWSANRPAVSAVAMEAAGAGLRDGLGALAAAVEGIVAGAAA